MKCFLDTNSLIHFRIFSEIDWQKELGVQNIEIVVCTTVLNELDRKKFAENDIDIRNRCKKIISKLSEFSSGSLIKEDTKLIFLNKEPRINWIAEGLSQDIQDDRIIASIIENEDLENVVLVTSDLGLRLKAQAKNIKVHKLSDELLVQVKKDKQSEEITKLKQKLYLLENKSPKLLLKIIDGNSIATFKKYFFNKTNPYDIHEASNSVKEQKDKLKYIDKKNDINNIYSSIMKFSTPSDEELLRYDKDLEKYLTDLNDYYESEWKYKDKLSRIFELKLTLINEGNEPAEDVDIFLHFPDGFSLFEKSKYPYPPNKPKEPEYPKSISEMIINYNSGITIPSNLLRTINTYHKPGLPKGTVTSPNIKKTNSYDVTFKIDKLKHKMNIELDSMFIYFESYDLIRSFSFEYKLLAGNCPEEFLGELNLIFP